MKKYVVALLCIMVIPAFAGSDNSIDSAVKDAIQDITTSAIIESAHTPKPWDSDTIFEKTN